MSLADLTAGDWFVLARHELILFAATFFLIGALDELALDFTYVWLRLTGRVRTPHIDEEVFLRRPLSGRCAVFIPAWREHRVIAATVRHALEVWPQGGLRLYVGCYREDLATLSAAMLGCRGDRRVRIVVHDSAGPTCKADCLNRLYRALQVDEAREGAAARMVVLHDAEDMVDPAALSLIDAALLHADFVQLPVLALPHAPRRWFRGTMPTSSLRPMPRRWWFAARSARAFPVRVWAARSSGDGFAASTCSAAGPDRSPAAR